MKKKLLAVTLAVMLAVSFAFVVTDDECSAAAKAKYVKVKQKTYNKMKKTIAAQKKTIASQKTTISKQNSTITSLNKTITDQKAQIEEKDTTIKKKNSTINWLYDSMEEAGYKYNYDTHRWEQTETSDPVYLDWMDMIGTEDVIPLMEEQTGLSIDAVYVMETWKTWACYYVEADGDLYVITMKKGEVDVCQILN